MTRPHPAPEGYMRCYSGEACVHPNGPILPATTEYFNKSKGKRFGLHGRCKACRLAYNQQHRERDRERASIWWQEHKDEANAKKRLQRDESKKAVERAWREKNIEKVRQYRRNDYYKHRDNILSKSRQDRRKDPERFKEKNKKAYAKHKLRFKAIAKVRRHKIRAAKANGQNFTRHDWERALSYFNGRCAVCGRQLNDLFGTLQASVDHWIPISQGGLNTPDNIVPLCNGTTGCNNRKGKLLPQKFLERTYGKRKARKILAEIEAYFEWVKQRGRG